MITVHIFIPQKIEKLVNHAVLTLREEHGLRVFQKRMLKRIFGPKREEKNYLFCDCYLSMKDNVTCFTRR
jgi:hypothetical protein